MSSFLSLALIEPEGPQSQEPISSEKTSMFLFISIATKFSKGKWSHFFSPHCYTDVVLICIYIVIMDDTNLLLLYLFYSAATEEVVTEQG